MKFNEKNERCFWNNISNSIIVTSNELNPLYCPVENRRLGYIKVNPVYKQNRKFFAKVRKCFNDCNIMHSFLMEIANLELGDWEPVHTNDPFQEEALRQKENAMYGSHAFIKNFFAKPDWPTKYMSSGKIHHWHVRNYEVVRVVQNPHKGEIRIRVQADRLYDIYKAYTLDKNPRSKSVSEKTFFDQLAKIGIEKKKQQLLHHVQKTCVDIFFNTVSARLKILFPTIELDWPTEQEDVCKRIIKYINENAKEFVDTKLNQFE